MYAFTAKDIHANKALPINSDFAIICFCELPKIFEEMRILKTDIRYFAHCHPFFVNFYRYKSYYFIVISEVYGGSALAPTIEELAFYGIDTIIGIGWVGSLDEDLKIGDNIFATSSLVEYGTTPHYFEYKQDDTFICTSNIDILKLKPAKVWTTNGFYRKTKELIDHALSLGCGVVNMETSPFYAVCENLKLNSVYYATVSDLLYEEHGQDNLAATFIQQLGNIGNINQRLLIETLLNSNLLLIQFHKQILELRRILQNVCDSHNYEHAIAVMTHAHKATDVEETKLSPIEKRAILLAALLHDADDKKFFPKHLHNQNARFILQHETIEFTECVIEMINLVSYSSNGDSILNVKQKWKLIPRYADRIESLGLIGIERCYQYTQTIGNPLILDTTPRPKLLEELYLIPRVHSNSMIDHYYDKLLHIGNFPINNQYLNSMAKEKTQIMYQFVLDFVNQPETYDPHFVEKFLLQH